MKSLLFSLFLVLSLAGSNQAVRAAEIAVLLSSEAAVYQEALRGFRETVQHRSLEVHLLSDRPEKLNDQLKTIRSVIEPDVILVIGTSALQAVTGKITHIPIVHAMVFNPPPGEGKNITGVSMIPAPDQSISLIKELNPKIRRVGIMYDPATSKSLYWQAQSVADKERLKIVDAKISSPGDIAAALKSFENQIDLLWLWPDDRFLADEILQRIFLFSFENRIPVLGLSERHTQMGALVSLSYGSAKDLGIQAGEMVNRILGRRTAPRALLTMPRQLKLTVNLKTARKLDVRVPDSIIRRADNSAKEPVYKDGDWWVFRIKMIDPNGASKTEIHRVVFKKDKFTSDDPSFLAGGDVAGTPYFLPFASVYLADPARRWLDFPLIAGKIWSFRYRVRSGGFAGGPKLTYQSVVAEAEVIGKASYPIETPAGKLEAIEIRRTDDLGGVLTYYYSPRSRSVVKLRARASGYQKGEYELELIAFGNGRNRAEDSR